MSAQHVDHAGTNPEPTPPVGPAMPPVQPRKRRRSRIGRLSVGLSGLATGAIILAGAGLYLLSHPAPKPEPKPAAETAAAAPVAAVKPPSITVVGARRGPITETALVTGNLVPREEILVAPQIDGSAIDEILVEEGDRVEKDQVLARLSRSMIDAGLAQSAAQIARSDAAIAQSKSSIADAEAAKEQTANAFARTKALKATGNTTEETLEGREAAARQADARLDLARNALAVAQADRNLAVAQQQEWQIRAQRSDIKAPSAGIVSRRTARIGAIAMTTGEPLFRIIENGDIELEANVPEATLARLKPGMAAAVTTAASETPYKGRVRLVAPEVNETTRLGRVRIALDAAPGLTIGAFGRGNVDVASRSGVLVPQSAVLYTETGASVQVVANGEISTRAVTVGLRSAREAEIVKGVADGDMVVATAGTFLRDGDRVTPVAAETQ
jgi:HlyD family secretion protein